MTSFRVVSLLRRALHIKRIGHAGTLDPAARGVLPIAVGNATRLLEYIPGDKAYRADVLLGASTDTHDAEGTVVATADASAVTRADVERVLAEIQARDTQVPPMASALHHEGQRLYQRFRRGGRIDLPARPVRIDHLAVVTFDNPRAVVDVDCGPGTYVRSVVRDLGDLLGCGAHLTALERTRSGPFTVEGARPLEEVLATPAFVSPRIVLASLPWVRLNPEGALHARQGKRIGPEDVEDRASLSWPGVSSVCVLAEGPDDVVGVGTWIAGTDPGIQPLKILA